MNNRPLLHKRNLLIDRKIQLPLLIYSIAMATVGVIIATFFSIYAAHLIDFKNDFAIATTFIVGCAAFCYSIMLILGLYISNKIAGPIYRMRIHMQDLCAGKDPGPLTTRDSDYVNDDLIKQYNQLIQHFKK